MQLIPEKPQARFGRDPFDARQNIRGAARST